MRLIWNIDRVIVNYGGYNVQCVIGVFLHREFLNQFRLSRGFVHLGTYLHKPGGLCRVKLTL